MEPKKEKEIPENNVRISSLITDTFSQTTAHGIPHLVRATSTTMRVVWSLVVFGAFGIFTAQSYQLLDDYLKYNFSVNMDLEYDSSPVYPAVTICNTNPITFDSLTRQVISYVNVWHFAFFRVFLNVYLLALN